MRGVTWAAIYCVMAVLYGFRPAVILLLAAHASGSKTLATSSALEPSTIGDLFRAFKDGAALTPSKFLPTPAGGCPWAKEAAAEKE